MVIMYDNFDLMKEPVDPRSPMNIDLMNVDYIPSSDIFVIPIKVMEVVKFTIFEGGRSIKTGSVIGNTFTATGKTQLATLVGRSDGLALSAIICTVSGTDYGGTLVDKTIPSNANTLRVTSSTFSVAGTYTVVAGANGSTKYNTISTNILVGAGQSVQYVIEYVFTGPSSTFSAHCAARFGAVNTGNLNNPIGTIKVTATDAVVYPVACTGTVIAGSNTLTINGNTGITSTGKTFNIWAFHTTVIDTAVYSVSGMVIPVASTQTLNVRGVFVFG